MFILLCMLIFSRNDLNFFILFVCVCCWCVDHFGTIVVDLKLLVYIYMHGCYIRFSDNVKYYVSMLLSLKLKINNNTDVASSSVIRYFVAMRALLACLCIARRRHHKQPSLLARH